MKKFITLVIMLVVLVQTACYSKRKCATYNPDKTYKARYNKKGLIKK